MAKHVYDFSEGGREMVDLLGGKGANLAEMSNLGLPVPPGFTITTEACRAFLAEGELPAGLNDEITEHLTKLEKTMGRKLGDPEDPLLVSVRSGARFSMPGMMDTVLDIGLNDLLGRRPDQAGRRRALCLGLVPPPHPDVRQDGHGRQRGPFRRSHRRAEGREERSHRPRPRHPRPEEAGSHLQKDREAGNGPRFPHRAARPARRRHPGRVQVLERRARPHLPPPGTHSRKPGDGREHLLHGVRQPGAQLGHGRRLHP